MRNQAKVLDKIIESTHNGKIEITQSDTEDLFDDSSTSDEEDLMFKSKINETFKAHSDSELDNEAIPFYFRDHANDEKDECIDIDQCVYRSTVSDEKEVKPLMPKSMSESPKNTDTEEKKAPMNKDGLNKDMLMKLDQQNLNHGKIPNKLFGPEFYYATPSIVSSTSNTTTTKTIKSKR